LTWYALCAVNTSVNAIPHPVYLDVTLDYTLVILLFSSADGLQPPELIVGWMDGWMDRRMLSNFFQITTPTVLARFLQIWHT